MNTGFFGLLSTNRARATSGEGGPVYLVNEGFEGTGAPSGWGGAADYDYTPALVGSQSLESATGEYAVYTLASSVDSLKLKFRFKVSSLPASFIKIAEVADAGYATIEYVALLSNGKLEGAGGQTVSAMSAGTEYDVWVTYTKGTGSNSVISAAFATAGSSEPTSGNNFVGTTSGNKTAQARVFFLGNLANDVSAIYDTVQASESTIGP